VLTRGYGDAVELLLRPVGGLSPGPAQTGVPPWLGQATSFSGDLPCADCEAIRYRLNLFPDRAFYLGTAYLGRAADEAFDIGSWDLSSNGRVLILQGGREAPLLFRVAGPDALTKLDLQGDDIDSALNYSLRRTRIFERIEPRLPMRGMYQYMADAGLFTECLTGQRWPVAQVEDNLALERAYLAARSRPAEQILVSLAAGVEVREDTQPDLRRPMLVPYLFLGTSPGEACAQRFATLPLEGTRWRLTQLQGEPLSPGEGWGAPELLFDRGGRRLSGTDGCNRLAAAYQLEGGHLHLGQVGATRMACPDGDDMQRRFAHMLARVERWNLLGRQLEFYDARGQRLARLEAVSAGDQ
jgi:copper homeostasis protein (lipoprotein)